jgi:hypothetical protein
MLSLILAASFTTQCAGGSCDVARGRAYYAAPAQAYSRSYSYTETESGYGYGAIREPVARRRRFGLFGRRARGW